MHWVAVAAACLEAFSRRLIILRLMVVRTAASVVVRKFSAALFKASWLSGSWGLEAQDLAASTILAVASASSLAAVSRRFCLVRVKKIEEMLIYNDDTLSSLWSTLGFDFEHAGKWVISSASYLFIKIIQGFFLVRIMK